MATIIILAAFGIVLIGLEVFMPGGILGLIGLGCPVGATVLCFTSDAVTEVGTWLSFVMAACVLAVSGTLLFFWLKYFQRTGLGKQFVLSSAVGDHAKKKENYEGKEGEAANDLSPLGRIVVGGKKLDARAESGTISKGSRVKVLRSNGMELVVRVVEQLGDDESAAG